ncbi:MAG: bifunctional DNA-formamidopyrimidine glycosylase/DNA-(apurinic or apyrimidinic site) lyase [Phycisphaerales bacterium]
MPELPEVERTRLSLLPLIGRTITRATLRRADICDSFNNDGAPLRTTTTDLLLHGRITSLTRRGKQLAIHTHDDRTLCIQLGMSGKLLLSPPPRGRGQGGGSNGENSSRPLDPRTSLPPHTHAHWLFDDHTHLLFIDPRRFGGLSTYPSTQALLTHRWSALGPDALTITARDLARACDNSHRPIKSLLLDQCAIAGVGNIYADESLFLARIRPTTHAARLKPPHITRLADAIREILKRAIRAGGSTLRNYTDSRGQPGRAQTLHAVYARANKPCIRCGTPLKSIRLAQRATVYCPHCQPP